MADYADAEDVAAFLGTSAPSDAARLIKRASELMDVATMNRYNVTPTPPAATLTRWETALKNAVCAQIEYWTNVDESIAIIGSPDSFSLSGFNQQGKLPDLAPRARNFLFLAGLLNRGVKISTRYLSTNGYDGL